MLGSDLVLLASSGVGLRTQYHGQKYSAPAVKKASRQFDRVRVEQNHCHGLRTETASCPIEKSQCQYATCRAIWREYCTVVHAVWLPMPYTDSASFHVK